MPIYEYECPECGIFEEWQGINDKPLTRCPICKKKKVRKIISESSFHLKGSGWYVTDYGGKTKANGAGKEKEAPSTESKTEVKSEPKTETKPTSKSPENKATAGSTAS